MHQQHRQWHLIGTCYQQTPPQLSSRLQHPRLVFKAIRRVQNFPVSCVAELVQAVQADQLGRSFHQFLREQLPVRSSGTYYQRISTLHHASNANDTGAYHLFSCISGGYHPFCKGNDNAVRQRCIQPLGWNAPNHRRCRFGKLNQLFAMWPFQSLQTEY